MDTILRTIGSDRDRNFEDQSTPIKYAAGRGLAGHGLGPFLRSSPSARARLAISVAEKVPGAGEVFCKSRHGSELSLSSKTQVFVSGFGSSKKFKVRTKDHEPENFKFWPNKRSFLIFLKSS